MIRDVQMQRLTAYGSLSLRLDQIPWLDGRIHNRAVRAAWWVVGGQWCLLLARQGAIFHCSTDEALGDRRLCMAWPAKDRFGFQSPTPRVVRVPADHPLRQRMRNEWEGVLAVGRAVEAEFSASAQTTPPTDSPRGSPGAAAPPSSTGRP